MRFYFPHFLSFPSNRKSRPELTYIFPHPPSLLQLTCNVIELGVCSPHFSTSPPKFLLPLLNCIDQKIFPSLYFATPPLKPPFLQIYKIYIYRDRFYFVVEKRRQPFQIRLPDLSLTCLFYNELCQKQFSLPRSQKNFVTFSLSLLSLFFSFCCYFDYAFLLFIFLSLRCLTSCFCSHGYFFQAHSIVLFLSCCHLFATKLRLPFS